MNKRQKEVQQSMLEDEKKVLDKLEQSYKSALDEINAKITILMNRDDADMQNVIYQVEYQKALQTQVQGILDQLHANKFETISEYLTQSYTNGYVGTMYDLHGQGVPLIIPINQEQVVAAIQHETKLSKSLYASIGKDTRRLSKQIASEISRGISSASTYSEMARNIGLQSKIPLNNAMRIARTEAHRIQSKATADAQHRAKERGADILKQWDAFLDGATRPSHKVLDGQIRELDEPFEINGEEVMQPGYFGLASEDCNCRCCLLQRARWALDERELQTLKDRAEYYELDKTKDFEEFREKYIKAIKSNVGFEGVPKTWKRSEQALNTTKSEVNPLSLNDNCTSCVVAMEMRKRGLMVHAGKMIKAVAKNPEKAWINPNVKTIIGETIYDDICAEMSKWGDGSRAQIDYIWNSRNKGSIIWQNEVKKGHSFFAEQHENKTVFIDSQSGTEYNKDIFKYMTENEMKFYRIDNLEISDIGISTCEKD